MTYCLRGVVTEGGLVKYILCLLADIPNHSEYADVKEPIGQNRLRLPYDRFDDAFFFRRQDGKVKHLREDR